MRRLTLPISFNWHLLNGGHFQVLSCFTASMFIHLVAAPPLVNQVDLMILMYRHYWICEDTEFYLQAIYSHKSRSPNNPEGGRYDYVLAFTKPKKDNNAPQNAATKLLIRTLSHNPAEGSMLSDSPDGPLHARILAAIRRYDSPAQISALDSSDFSLKLFGIRFSEETLQRVAEKHRVVKLAKTGLALPFSEGLRHAFSVLPNGSVFTSAERIRLAMLMFDEIQVQYSASEDGEAPPGSTNGEGGSGAAETAPGGSSPEASQQATDGIDTVSAAGNEEPRKSIADLLLLDIVRGFPTHDARDLDWLYEHWVGNVLGTFRQPLDHIALYFGEAIAFYFAWLQHYSKALVLPSMLGLLLYLLQGYGDSSSAWPTVLFSLAMAVWGTVVMKLWKRQQSGLAHDWGVYGYEANEQMRPQYLGEKFINPLTGEPDKSEKMWKQLMRFALVTIPAMALMIIVSIAFMAGTSHLKLVLDSHLPPGKSASGAIEEGAGAALPEIWDIQPWLASLLKFTPTLLFGVGVPALDAVNGNIATLLVNFENHKTDIQYENSLIGKKALLQFLNNFVALFYIAFIQQDLDELRSRLVFLLVWKAILNNIQEVALPLFKSEASLIVAKVEGQRAHSLTSSEFPNVTAAPATGTVMQATESAISSTTPAQLESQLQAYDPYDDILEMFVQFGHVTLFAAVFPLAPLCALFNNVMEVHSDAFKLCSMQRPYPKRATGLGSWTSAFEAVGYVAVASNVALFGVAASKGGAMATWDTPSIIMTCVIIEHLLIALKVVMDARVADVPEKLRMKAALESKLRTRVTEGLRNGVDATAIRGVPIRSPTAIKAFTSAAEAVSKKHV